MSRYTKDEINFHGFLNAMRKLHNVTLEQVCEGLCSVSMMKRIESGERLPEKLMRDRMMARMGVSLDGYEDYLPPDEYEQWCLRQNIIRSIEKKELEKTEYYLSEYKKVTDRNAVELQFHDAMYFMYLKLRNASLTMQKEVIMRAIKHTIPDIDKVFHAGVLLSNQELNLLIEYIWISENCNESGVEKAYHIEYYKGLLEYIEKSEMNKYEQAKIYPKVAYYACRMAVFKAKTFEVEQWALEICDKALDLLFAMEKLYYVTELLEIRERLVNEIQFFYRKEGKREAAEELLKTQDEKKEIEELLRELYAEYKVSLYVENFCYLYWETESYCIGDIVKIRRQMLGLTKEQLCDGICSEKTLTRIEQRKVKAQMPIVRELFGRLGLCEEYTRARVITSDYQTLELADRLAWYENTSQFEEWEKCLDELESRLCMDIPQNQQVILQGKYLLELEMKKIFMHEFEKRIEEIIEITIPLQSVMKSEKQFLTREEAILIYNIGAKQDIENPYMEIIEAICEQYERNEEINAHMRRYELFASGLASYHGNIGKYELSNERSRRLIQASLLHYRMSLLSYCLYNNLWNEQQKRKNDDNKKYLQKDMNVLKQCILLSQSAKVENEIKFYKEKLSIYTEDKY